MIVGAGGSLDPVDKLGLAQLTASLLTQGTTTRSASELNEEVDFIGGYIDSGAGNDLTFLTTVVMKDSFDLGLDLLSDIARRPAFAPDEIDRQREQTLSGLQVSFGDPAFVADAVFARLVYGFHPYGAPQSGTPETIASLVRDDLVSYHSRYFVPNNAILAVVGDLTAEEAFAGVERAFGNWERRELERPLFSAPPEPTGRVVVVDMPGAVQTELRVGHLGIRRADDDYMPLDLAARILGGEGANRLFQVLRTERGLTYGAEARMYAGRETGDLEASTSTRSDTTAEALRLMVDEFWRLQRERVGERELSDAKAYMTGSFPLDIETPDAIATEVLNALAFGLPVDQLESFRRRVNAVSVDDIQRVARHYFRPDRLSVVLVGNASVFASRLRSAGLGEFEVIEMDELDLTAPNLRKAGPPGQAKGGGAGAAAGGFLAANIRLAANHPAYLQSSAPAAAPAGDADAQGLLDRVIAAKGGLERLRSIGGIRAVTSAEVITPDGPVEAETTTYLEYPDHVRVETELPDATIVQVFDGRRGWVVDPDGTHDVPDAAVRELQASLRRDTMSVLLAAGAGRVKARVLPDVRDASGSVLRRLELSGPGLDPMVLFVHPETHLISKQTYVVGGVGQPLVEEVFSDYREVDGVQVAFVAELRRGGELVLERRVREIAIDPGFDPGLFSRPGF
jgi:zinc protease